MLMFRRPLALLALALSFLALPAQARDEVPPSLDYAAMVQSGISNGEVAEALQQVATAAFSAPASSVGTESAAISPDAGFTGDAEVRRETEQQLIEAAGPEREVLRDLLGKGRVMMRFERRLAGYGYSSTNLPDVMTTFYVTAWEVVNDTDALENPTGVTAARQQVAAAFTSSHLPELADEEKERLAYTLALIASLAELSREQLARDGDEEGLKQLQDSLQQALQQQGLDPRRLMLTTEGFILH